MRVCGITALVFLCLATPVQWATYQGRSLSRAQSCQGYSPGHWGNGERRS